MSDPGPPTPPGEPLAAEPAADLVAYLRRYGDRYTREAMAARLIEGGHDPDAVERALAAVDVEAPPVAAVDDHQGARMVTRAIVVSAVLVLVGWVLAAGFRGPGAAAFVGATIVLGGLVAGGAIWWIGRVDTVAQMAAVTVLAVVIGLPVAFLGGCIAWANTGGRLFG